VNKRKLINNKNKKIEMANSKFKSWLAQEGSERFGSKEFFKSYLFIIIGTALYVGADIIFAYPYNLAPGGVGGLSNVLNVLFPWKVSYYYYAMNVPLFIIGFIVLGPKFGIKTMLSVIVSFLVIWLVEVHLAYEPVIKIGELFSKDPTASLQNGEYSWASNLFLKVERENLGMEPFWFMPDYMLNTVIAGVIYGIGIGMIFKAGATSGGSDIISMIIHKYTNISLGTLVIIVDTTISCTSFLINHDFRFPIYSIILVYIEGKIIDMIVPPPPKKKKEKEIAQAA
ncbi:MAG: YitT family protein, partial [Bacteroidales bacterium]|nr:YitT family protein [Bacteroidales bacterium]